MRRPIPSLTATAAAFTTVIFLAGAAIAAPKARGDKPPTAAQTKDGLAVLAALAQCQRDLKAEPKNAEQFRACTRAQFHTSMTEPQQKDLALWFEGADEVQHASFKGCGRLVRSRALAAAVEHDFRLCGAPSLASSGGKMVPMEHVAYFKGKGSETRLSWYEVAEKAAR